MRPKGFLAVCASSQRPRDPVPLLLVVPLGHDGGVLLVILGAGASYNSAEADDVDPSRRHEIAEWQPPLAKELFQARSHFGAAIGRLSDYSSGLVSELRAAVSANKPLEQLLDEVMVRAATDSRSSTELMALRYYLREVIAACSANWLAMTHQVTNYHFLVHRLDRWARAANECALYVTFNYDILLEHACRQVELYVTDLESYTSHPRAKLFKPHGSINWAHHVEFDMVPGVSERDYVIRNASSIKVPPAIEVRTNWRAGVRGQEWIPALAVPVETKGEFECPPEHMETLRALLPTVDRVLVIGWRATEQNFIDLLKGESPKALRRILIACKSKHDSRHVWQQLERAFKVDQFDLGFKELWDQGQSNFENSLSFSDLVKQPTLLDSLLDHHPPVHIAIR